MRKREYKNIIISTKVEWWVYDQLKQGAEEQKTSIYALSRALCYLFAKNRRKNEADIIPAELEEIFDGFSVLSHEDFQTTKKGVSI